MGGGSLEAPSSITGSKKSKSKDDDGEMKDLVIGKTHELIDMRNVGNGLDVGKGNYDGW